MTDTDKPVKLVFSGDLSIAHCGNGVYTIYKKEELNIDKSWTLLRGGGVLFDKRRGSRASWVGEKVGRK